VTKVKVGRFPTGLTTGHGSGVGIELEERHRADDALEHDREWDPDEQVHALPVERLAEVEDVPDGDPSRDEGEPFGYSPRPTRRVSSSWSLRSRVPWRYRSAASSDGPTCLSSQEFSCLDARRKMTTRSFALRVPSQAPTGHCFQLIRPL
jgi:hypothetical protein